MKRMLRGLSVICLVATFLTIAAPARAQAPATATAFYMEYRKAFDAARKVEDLLPYLSAATKTQIESTPPAERPRMFEMFKMMGAVTDVKVTQEARNPDGGATLTVTATDQDKKAANGTVTIVKEGGMFKLGRESW